MVGNKLGKAFSSTVPFVHVEHPLVVTWNGSQVGVRVIAQQRHYNCPIMGIGLPPISKGVLART